MLFRECFLACRARRLGRWSPLLLCLLLLSAAPPVRAQAPAQSEELRELRDELRRLREELAALRDELRRGPAISAAPAAAAQAPETAATLQLLQAQVAEHAQTKVESNSRLAVKLFGTIHSSTFFNSGEANWMDLPNLADVAPPAPLHRGSFSSNLRQSRIGLLVDGPAIGGMKASGVIAFDFFGGVPNFQTGSVIGLPRLLYAFARLEGERTAFEVGQDQMILAPANPTSLAGMAFPNLYRAGNLYLRAPQIRMERRFAAGEQSEFQLMGGILAPVGGMMGPSSFEFVPPNLAGERSRQPAVQARLGWKVRSRSSEREQSFEIGLSGHTAGQRTLLSSRRSWATAMDFEARVGRFALAGEGFAGQNIASFGGALGQSARSAGGFIEGRVQASPRLGLNAGVGIDRLFDLGDFPAALKRNSSVFANFIYDLTPELATSLEYRWLSTVPVSAAARQNQQIHLAFAYRF